MLPTDLFMPCLKQRSKRQPPTRLDVVVFSRACLCFESTSSPLIAGTDRERCNLLVSSIRHMGHGAGRIRIGSNGFGSRGSRFGLVCPAPVHVLPISMIFLDPFKWWKSSRAAWPWTQNFKLNWGSSSNQKCGQLSTTVSMFHWGRLAN